jgi:hypothetical protein
MDPDTGACRRTNRGRSNALRSTTALIAASCRGEDGDARVTTPTETSAPSDHDDDAFGAGGGAEYGDVDLQVDAARVEGSM